MTQYTKPKYVVRTATGFAPAHDQYLQRDGTFGAYATAKRFTTQAKADIAATATGVVCGLFPCSTPRAMSEPFATWDAGAVKGWRDRMGGIRIAHDDGAETYMQPGDHASDLARTLDQCGADKENIGVLLCDQLERIES